MKLSAHKQIMAEASEGRLRNTIDVQLDALIDNPSPEQGLFAATIILERVNDLIGHIHAVSGDDVPWTVTASVVRGEGAA